VHEKKGSWKGSMEIVAELRRENGKLKADLEHYKKQFNRYEAGSRKSALNIHPESKINLQRYIELTCYKGTTTGEYIRNIISKHEPYTYEQIIGGEF
jgi:hypothetical protein